ncbi:MULTISPECIES: hypothetical protein [unclassified Croceitalea]|uniref:hypothetical protein n=1 Tax=unclassified Croceitalea TaxID=2632280 RepID=UPI0030D6D437
MKQLGTIVLVLMTIPFGLWGQGMGLPNTESFYASLAEKDTRYELNYNFASVEDERDFWKDQKSFERVLALKNSKAYQYYLKYKAKYYRQHKLVCSSKCLHSELFEKNTSIYFEAYPNSTSIEALVSTNKNK